MEPTQSLSSCGLSCKLSRRTFLNRCAACAAAAPFVAHNWTGAAEAQSPTRIRIVYALHADKQPGPDWPNQGFEFGPAMRLIHDQLSRRCHGFEFLTSTAAGEEQAKQILAQDAGGQIDGYVVVQMNCWNRVVQTIATSGKPVLYTDFKYGGSGGFLTYTAAFVRQSTPNVGFIASSQVSDLAEAVKGFSSAKDSVQSFAAATERCRLRRTHKAGDLTCRADALTCIPARECLKRLSQSKILVVRNQEAGPAGSIMGIPIQQVPFAELNEAWRLADKEEAAAVADRWTHAAEKVTDVSRETLEQSAAMYLAERSLLKKHGAGAITVNCLGGFYGGHIKAYPCLGFYQLNSDGLVGGCEGDIRSAATMLAFTTLTQGRPGYISDPVIDTAKRQIIYAHCVAHNRAFGAKGEANPFQILTHSEDRQGASIRSTLPLGYMTTTLQVSQDRKEILLHQGKAVANDPDDRACRTKLCVEPMGEFEKLFTQWDQWGWHRVTFYGDLKEPVRELADALGWKVVAEA